MISRYIFDNPECISPESICVVWNRLPKHVTKTLPFGLMKNIKMVDPSTGEVCEKSVVFLKPVEDYEDCKIKRLHQITDYLEIAEVS